jgi:hypothetical protein
MVASGYGRYLYHRQKQWWVVQEGFTTEHEPPMIREQVVLPAHQRRDLLPEDDVRHDAEKLMSWFMGSDSVGWSQFGSAIGTVMAAVPPAPNPLWQPLLVMLANHKLTPELLEELETPAIGGPLYPPVHALVYAPLGLLPPQSAYRLFQVLVLGFIFLAAAAIHQLSDRRIPWWLATIGLLFYPGTRASLDLGQNPTITLAILLWGWLAFARGREIIAGCLWGCLAFKPTWAAAFVLVPLIMGRWKFLLAMIVTSGLWVLSTLPIVGLHSWWDWLQVGRLANRLYCVNYNWIHLSRDLHGIPRRWLHDFSIPPEHRDTLVAQLCGWALWGIVLLLTTFVYRRQVCSPRATGIGAAFLLMGAWLCCYRCMYYDVLLTALPFAALLADPQWWQLQRPLLLLPSDPSAIDSSTVTTSNALPTASRSRLWVYINSTPLTLLTALYLVENFLIGLNLQVTIGIGYYAVSTQQTDGTTTLQVPTWTIATGLHYPWDTFLVLLLWLWCAVQLLTGRAPDSVGANSV